MFLLKSIASFHCSYKFILPLSVAMLILGISCSKHEVAVNKSPMPQAAVDTPGADPFANVVISYRLIDDSYSQACIHVEFSTDGGRTYHPATICGGDGNDYLATTADPGYGHVAIWDTVADGIIKETCIVRISPTSMTTYLQGSPGKTAQFQVDNLREPVISWVSKPKGTVRQVPLTFTWKLDTPEIPVINYFYGLDEDPPTSSTTNTSVTIPAPPLGGHTFRVFAQNVMLLNSTVIQATFTADNAAANIPPTVEITSGPSGDTLDNTPTFTYMGFDVDGSIAGYFVSIDVNPPDIWTSDNTWTSPELSNTAHVFYVMAQDNDGTNSGIVTRSFTIIENTGNILPTVAITGGPTGVISQNATTFTYEGSDTDGTIVGYFVSLNTDPPDIWTTGNTWTTPELADGDYTFYVMAQDNDGANSNIATRTFSVDTTPPPNQPPTVTITSGPSGVTSDNTPAFTYSGSDSDGTVVGYFVSIDVNPPDIWTTNTSWTSPELSCGSYTFYIIAQDDNGANSSVVSRDFDVVDPIIIYVDGTNGNDSNNGQSWAMAVRTIQRGIDLAGSTDYTVLVAEGIYAGSGNIDLNIAGKEILIKGTGKCIIDCEDKSRAFYIANGETKNTEISGFTIKNGYTNGFGAGIYCAANPVITNCEFMDHSGGRGGAFYFGTSASPEVTNCTFINCAASYGGALYCENNSKPIITGCLFDKNGIWTSLGGVIYCRGGTLAVIRNCDFTNNNAISEGGAIYCHGSSLGIFNSIFYDGFSRFGGGISFRDNSSAVITQTVFESNGASMEGGAIYISAGSEYVIDNCQFNYNQSLWTGGAIKSAGAQHYKISSSSFCNNLGGTFGGGICHFGCASSQFLTCIFDNNAAPNGGGMFLCTGQQIITHCSFNNNFSDEYGGTVSCGRNTNLVFLNTIIGGGQALSSGDNFYIEPDPSYPSYITLSYCCYDNSSPGHVGGAIANLDYSDYCITSDPSFVPSTLRLSTGSPCIDTGCNSFVPLEVIEDLDGNPRMIDGNIPLDGVSTVDMGAYEYQP